MFRISQKGGGNLRGRRTFGRYFSGGRDERGRLQGAIGIRWMVAAGNKKGFLPFFENSLSIDFHFRFEFVIDDGGDRIAGVRSWVHLDYRIYRVLLNFGWTRIFTVFERCYDVFSLPFRPNKNFGSASLASLSISSRRVIYKSWVIGRVRRDAAHLLIRMLYACN